MRKAFAMACCFLTACSILPEDSFTDIPRARLQTITITSNTGKDPVTGNDLDPEEFPSLTAFADVTAESSNKITIDWSGDLNLFWFSSPVVKTEYQFNSDDLVSEIVLTMENNVVQTETFTYNNDGNLKKMVANFDDSFLAVYDFFYVDGVLDSISKYTEYGSYINTGFFKRNYNADPGLNKFSFIYPFTENSEWSVEENDHCAPFQTVNENVGRMSYFTFSEGYQRLAAKVSIPDVDDYFYYNKSDMNYETNFSKVVNRVQRIQLFNREDEVDCGPVKSLSLNYYALIDPLNENYQLLGMIDATESMIVMTWQPERAMQYLDLTFDYEYAYSE
jgi:hypothetical protein